MVHLTNRVSSTSLTHQSWKLLMRCVGSVHYRHPYRMTLKQWLARLHVSVLRRVGVKGYVSTSVRKGRTSTVYVMRGKSGYPCIGYSQARRNASLHKTAIMMRRGSPSRIVLHVTAIGSTQCLHTIFYTPHCLTILALSQRSIPTTHTIKTKANY